MMKKMVLALLLSAGSVYGQAWELVVLQEASNIDSAWTIAPTTPENISLFVMSLYAASDSVWCFEPDEDELMYQVIDLRGTGGVIKSAHVSFLRKDELSVVLYEN
tara:strand:+ start:18356 stop:18670 length:315 start_codon:yes stop_codon:yes gene_type:complete